VTGWPYLAPVNSSSKERGSLIKDYEFELWFSDITAQNNLFLFDSFIVLQSSMKAKVHVMFS